MFGLLVAIGLETMRTACRAQEERHAAVYLIITGLLSIVAVTDSLDSLHVTTALVVMVVMLVYYALLLYYSDSMFWLVLHLSAPSMLMIASRLESYGIWQKSLVLYFLAATIIHQGLLAQELPRRRRVKHRRVLIQVGRKRVADFS